jgi:CTP:phosphocholine cytidylyltransferase-like protein
MAKICILTAGKGTRMGAFSLYANKAILPIDGKAVITHIIQKFPKDSKFVIAVGYLGSQVKSYIRLAHPSLNVQFVEVQNYDGEGSGPGYSLKCCKDFLMEPFYFVSCDTLWEENLQPDETENWVGVDYISQEKSIAFCNFSVKDKVVVDIKDKQTVPSEGHAAFAGLCFIKDYAIFWGGLESRRTISGELQVSLGLEALIQKSTVITREIGWVDVGSYEGYKNELSRFENYDFSKTDEFLYQVNRRVIKFFADPKIAAGRIKKASLNPEIFPKINGSSEQFYSYDFVNGETLYTKNSVELFKSFLEFMDAKVWKRSPNFNSVKFQNICKYFYYEKTLGRIEKYFLKYPDDEAAYVMGASMPKLAELLNLIPWEEFYNGIPSFMHGDLQFDNVISNDNDDFTLLDWRQDFGGEVEVGDLYYDLGKLAGGLLLNYDYIKLNLLSYSENKKLSGIHVDFDFATRFSGSEYSKILESFILEKGLDLKKVKLLVPIIYLNMAPLHHYPFDKMLFSLGKLLLAQQLTTVKGR